MTSAYTIHSTHQTLRDTPEHLDFHIGTGDYFAFLATAMGFMQEGLARCDDESTEYKFAKDLREDLRYLHQHYTIVPKEPKH